MYGATGEAGSWIEHNDRYRGISYSIVEPVSGGGQTQYSEPSPDYFTYVDHGGPGLVPVGYGYRSVAYIVERAIELEKGDRDLNGRRALLKQWDDAGIMATPANSSFNEAVIEAARASIAQDGATVKIASE
jgi:D-galacturonate reductase